MGYGGADLGILKLLNDLPREALPFGAYWVHPHEPHGQVREWLARRQGVWVRSGWFDEVMLLIRNVFVLPHLSAERFTRIFQEYQQKFQELSASIQEKPADEAGVQALKQALSDTEALFPGFWKVIIEASRLETPDPERANDVYRQGVTQFPQEALLLGSYALFLQNVRKDSDAADAMYKRALEADPKNARNLGNYANFLTDVRKDHAAAEAMYKRALEADPQHATNRANLARLFLANGNADGLAVLRGAMESLRENPLPQLELECVFYLFAHGPPQQRIEALRTARRLAESGVRSPGWDLSRNVERARLDGHSEGSWLSKLAAVINGDAQPAVLNDWPAWTSATA